MTFLEEYMALQPGSPEMSKFFGRKPGGPLKTQKPEAKIQAPIEAPRRGPLSEATSALGAGVVSTMESVSGTLEMLGVPGAETAVDYWEEMSKAGPLQRPRYLQEGTVLDHPGRLGDWRWWTRSLGENLPNMAAMMLPGLGALKAAKVAGWGAKAIRAAGTLGAFSGAATVEGGAQYLQAKREMEAEGWTDPIEIERVATAEGLTTAAVNGILEVLPFENLFLRSWGGDRIIKRFVKQAFLEGSTEVAQEGVSLLVSRMGHKVEPGLKESIGQMLEAGLIGAALGGGSGAILGGDEGIQEDRKDKTRTTAPLTSSATATTEAAESPHRAKEQAERETVARRAQARNRAEEMLEAIVVEEERTRAEAEAIRKQQEGTDDAGRLRGDEGPILSGETPPVAEEPPGAEIGQKGPEAVVQERPGQGGPDTQRPGSGQPGRPGDVTPSEDPEAEQWAEQNPEPREFIHNRIQELGNLKAVDWHYGGAAEQKGKPLTLVQRYARLAARRILPEEEIEETPTPTTTTGPGPARTEVSQTAAAKTPGEKSGLPKEGAGAAAGPTPSGEQATPRKGPSSEKQQPNEFGVYPDAEKVKVPIPKAARHRAVVRVALGEDGKWRSSLEADQLYGSHSGGGGLPHVDHEGHETREQAVLEQLHRLREELRKRLSRGDDLVKPETHEKRVQSALRAVDKEIKAWGGKQTPPASPSPPGVVTDEDIEALPKYSLQKETSGIYKGGYRATVVEGPRKGTMAFGNDKEQARHELARILFANPRRDKAREKVERAKKKDVTGRKPKEKKPQAKDPAEMTLDEFSENVGLGTKYPALAPGTSQTRMVYRNLLQDAVFDTGSAVSEELLRTQMPRAFVPTKDTVAEKLEQLKSGKQIPDTDPAFGFLLRRNLSIRPPGNARYIKNVTEEGEKVLAGRKRKHEAPEAPAAGEIVFTEEDERKVKESFFEGKKAAEELGERQVIYFTGGLPGSGKGGVVRKLSSRDDVVTVDPDLVKEKAGYAGRAAEFHEISSRVAKEVAAESIRGGYNTVWDSLLSNFPLARKFIDAVLEGEGETWLHFVHVDWEASITRSRVRFLFGESEREIPPAVSIKGHNYALPTFRALMEHYKDKPDVHFLLTDNNRDGEKKILVFEKAGDALQVHDQKLFDSIMDFSYHKVEGGEKDGYYVRDHQSSEADYRSKETEISRRADQLLRDKRAAEGGSVHPAQSEEGPVETEKEPEPAPTGSRGGESTPSASVVSGPEEGQQLRWVAQRDMTGKEHQWRIYQGDNELGFIVGHLASANQGGDTYSVSAVKDPSAGLLTGKEYFDNLETIDPPEKFAGKFGAWNNLEEAKKALVEHLGLEGKEIKEPLPGPPPPKKTAEKPAGAASLAGKKTPAKRKKRASRYSTKIESFKDGDQIGVYRDGEVIAVGNWQDGKLVGDLEFTDPKYRKNNFIRKAVVRAVEEAQKGQAGPAEKETAEAPAPPTKEVPEQTAGKAMKALRKDLEQKGAGRISGVDFKILQRDDGRSYYYTYTEAGVRYTEGPAGATLWSRDHAILEAMKKAEDFAYPPPAPQETPEPETGAPVAKQAPPAENLPGDLKSLKSLKKKTEKELKNTRGRMPVAYEMAINDRGESLRRLEGEIAELEKRLSAVKRAIREKEAPTTKEAPPQPPTADDLLAEIDKQFGAAEEAAAPAPTAREKAAETAEHLKAITEGAKRLNKLFGEEGALSWRDISDDDSTWQQAKPILQEMWDHAVKAGQSAKEFVALVLQTLGVKARPYFEKFVREEIGGESHGQAPEPGETQGTEAGGPASPGRLDVSGVSGSPETSPGELPRAGEGTLSERPGPAAPEVPASGAEGHPAPGDTGTGGEPGSGPDRGARVSERGGAPARPGGRPEPAEGASRGGPAADTGVGTEPALAPEDQNHRIGPDDVLAPPGVEGKIQGNIKALRLLRLLQQENRNPNPDEKKILAQYVGWGAFAQKVFNSDFDYYVRHHKDSFSPDRWFSSSKDLTKYQEWLKKYGKPLHPALDGMMSEEEWSRAADSTLNAHFTSREIIDGIWQLIRRLGFTGGTILEPAAGVGHFLGMAPEGIARRSRFMAVELDAVTGQILEKLYPEAHVQITGFEKARGVPDNSVDLVVSNFPFGDFSVYDKAHPQYNKWSIHNYFFGRSLDTVRPGGLVVGITSHYSLDARTGGPIREALAKKADLIGAIRLPNDAFKRNAGTEVVTDIIVLRKKAEDQVGLGEDFRNVIDVQVGNQETPINEYFTAHPEMVLGEHSMKGTMYSSNEYTVMPGKEELGKALAAAVERFPEGVVGRVDMVAKSSDDKPRFAAMSERDGTLVERDGEMFMVESGRLVEPWMLDSKGKRVQALAAATRKKRAKAYLDIRQKAKVLIERSQAHDATDEEVEGLRKGLDQAYDTYVDKYKRFGDPANSFLRQIDSEFPIVDALEIEKVVPEEVTIKSGKRRGEVRTVNVKVFEKAPILTRRTLWPWKEPETAEDLADAIKISRVYRGTLDPEFIAGLLGQDQARTEKALLKQGEAYWNPETGRMEPADLYLSGNVKAKLDKARSQAEEDARYAPNVKALEAVQPEPLDLEFISFRLGSPWIPGDAVAEYLRETMDVVAEVSQVRAQEMVSWVVKATAGKYDVKNTQTWGTSRRPGHKLVQDALNLRRSTIYDYWTDDDGSRHRELNQDETLAAQAKQAEIQDSFQGWVRTHETWGPRFADIYNANYNGHRVREYPVPEIDNFPGANPDFVLRETSKKAIVRCLQEPTLLAYGVGTGKTFIYVHLAMEMRRLQTARKPLIVVHNATVSQYRKAFAEAYPQAKVLIPNDTQRTARYRQKLLSQIATGDWDAVVIPQSFFDGIADDPDRQIAFIHEQLDLLEDAITEARFQSDEGNNDPTVKDLRKLRKRKDQQLQRLLDRRVDDALTFEKLGIDALLIDEAHAYKRSEFHTKMTRIKGIDQGASQRSTSLMLKADYVRQKTGGKNVVLATGTPISNTTAEIWTMMRYVRPDLLREYQVELFDDFAATFGETTVTLEETQPGVWRNVERFNKYVNGPELLTLFHTVTDVLLTNKANLKLPEIKGERPQSVEIEPYPALSHYIDMIRRQREEWEQLTGREKMAQRHVPLVLYGNARKAAVDLRLIDPDAYGDHPESKLNRVVDMVYEIWERTAQERSTQAVFLDLRRSGDGQFDAHQDIRQKLIDRGVPAEEIGVAEEAGTDAKREALFQRVREGECRVIIGSTEKLGIGVNMQDRLYAAHHVDVPHRPMDLEQRNGRIVREKNRNPEVEIYNFGVKKTLDSVSYDRLVKKQRFIDQMLIGEIEGRTFDEPNSEEQLSFAEMQAAFAGDPLVFERVDLDQKVKEFRVLRNAYEARVSRARSSLRWKRETTVPNMKKAIKEAERAATAVSGALPGGEFAQVSWDGRDLDRKAFRQALTARLEEVEVGFKKDYDGMSFKDYHEVSARDGDEVDVSFSAGGLDVTVRVWPWVNYDHYLAMDKPSTPVEYAGMNAEISISLPDHDPISKRFPVVRPAGLMTRIENWSQEVIRLPEQMKGELEKAQSEIAELEKVATETFDRADDLAQAERRLREVDAQLEQNARQGLHDQEPEAPAGEENNEALAREISGSTGAPDVTGRQPKSSEKKSPTDPKTYFRNARREIGAKPLVTKMIEEDYRCIRAHSDKMGDGISGDAAWLLFDEFVPEKLKERFENSDNITGPADADVALRGLGTPSPAEYVFSFRPEKGVDGTYHDLAVFENEAGILSFFNEHFIAYLQRHIKDFRLAFEGRGVPAVIYSGDKTAGVILPVDLRKSPDASSVDQLQEARKAKKEAREPEMPETKLALGRPVSLRLDPERPYLLTPRQFKNSRKIAAQVREWMKQAGANPEVLERIDIDLKPILGPYGANVEKSLAEWEEEGIGEPRPVLGATTVEPMHAVVQLALNSQNLKELERTTYHEWFHVAMRWMLPERDRARILKHYKTEERAAEAFAEFMARRKTQGPVGLVSAIWRKLRRMLQIVRNGLLGLGFHRPEDVFGKLRVGVYRAHFAEREGPTQIRFAFGGGKAKAEKMLAENENLIGARRYIKVKFKEQPTGKTRSVFLGNVKETSKFIQGIEYSKAGDPVVPKGYDERLRVIDRETIVDVEEYRMHKQYGDLERYYSPEEIRKETEPLASEPSGPTQPAETLLRLQKQPTGAEVADDVERNRSFVNKLFEMRDQGKHHITQAVGRLQKDLQALAGPESRRKFPLGFAYDRKLKRSRVSDQLDRAMFLYRDLQAAPEKAAEYRAWAAERLESPDVKPREKLTIKGNLRILDLAENLSEEQKAFVSRMGEFFEEAYELARKANLVRSHRDHYVRRIWKVPEGKENQFQAGGITEHGFKVGFEPGKQRTFETVIDGWQAGYELTVQGITNAYGRYMTELATVLANKAFLQRGVNTHGIDGRPLFSTRGVKGYAPLAADGFKVWRWAGKVSAESELPPEDTMVVDTYGRRFWASPPEHIPERWAVYKNDTTTQPSKVCLSEEEALAYAREKGYDRIVHRPGENVTDLFEKQQLYAPKPIADMINKMTAKDTLFRQTPGAEALLRLNAGLKAWILMSSFFHHLAGARSWIFGVHHGWKGGKWNPVAAYKSGLDKVNDLHPLVELGVKNGLTLGELQDWSEHDLRDREGLTERLVKYLGWEKAAKAIERGKFHRESWADSLFKKFFSGLKVEAFVIEYTHELQKAQDAWEAGKRDHPPNADRIAERVARLINADFGGLHLQRMGRNPTLQKLGRLALLAPDWTESNFRTVSGMIPGLNEKIAKIMGDVPGPKGMEEIYRKFWGRVMLRIAVSTILAQMLLGADDAGEFYKEQLLSKEFKRFRWTGVDVTRIYRALGIELDGARKTFSVGGHFFDPLKLLSPARLAKGKGSPITRVIGALGSGTDWADRPFTGVKELATEGRTVKKSAHEPVEGEFNRLPSLVVNQVTDMQPIQVGHALRYLAGEEDGLSALLQSIGVHVHSAWKPRITTPVIRTEKAPEAFDEVQRLLDAEVLGMAPPSRHLTINGISHELSRERYGRYLQESSERAMVRLARSMAGERWKRYTPERRAEIAAKVIKAARRRVRQKIKREILREKRRAAND